MKPATRPAVLGGVAATIYQLEAYGVLVALPSMASAMKLGPSGTAWIPAAYPVTATGYSMVGVFAPESERWAILGWLTVGAGKGMILGAPLGGWLAGAFSGACCLVFWRC